jgi:hypothetical protein
LWVPQPTSVWSGVPDAAATVTGTTNTGLSTTDYVVRIQFPTPPVEPVTVEVWNAAGGSTTAGATLVDGWWQASFPAYGPVTGDTRITVFNNGAYVSMTSVQVVIGPPPEPPPEVGETDWSGYVDPTPHPVEGGEIWEEWGYADEAAWVDGRTLSDAETAGALDVVYLPVRGVFAGDSASAVDTSRSEPTQGAETGTALDRVALREISVTDLGRAGEAPGYGELPPGLIAQISANALAGYSDGQAVTGVVPDESGAGNSGTVLNNVQYRAGVTPNGGPALGNTIDWDGGSLQFPDTMWTGKTGGHLFVYVRPPDTLPLGINYGPWGMGHAAGAPGTAYPSNPYGYPSVRDSAFLPYEESISTAGSDVLGRWSIYEFSAGGTYYTLPAPLYGEYGSQRIDGVRWNTVSYAFQVPAPPFYLMRSYYQVGQFLIAEFLAFDRVLSDAEAEGVRGYLINRYGYPTPGRDTAVGSDDAVLEVPPFESTDTAQAVDAVYIPYRVLLAHETGTAVDARVNPPGVLFDSEEAAGSDTVGDRTLSGADATAGTDVAHEFSIEGGVEDTAASGDAVIQLAPDLTEISVFDSGNGAEAQTALPDVTANEAGVALEGYVDAVIDVVTFSDGGFPATVTPSSHVAVIPTTAPSGGTSVAPFVARLDGNHEDDSTRSLTLDLTDHETPAAGVRFRHSASSENQYDLGQVRFEGGTPLIRISGTYPWSVCTAYPVGGGTPTAAIWEYVKDAGLFGGQDSYYVSQIEILGHVDTQQRWDATDTGTGVDAESVEEDAYLGPDSGTADFTTALAAEITDADGAAGVDDYLEDVYDTVDFQTGIPASLVLRPGTAAGNLSVQTYSYGSSGFYGDVEPAPAKFLRVGAVTTGYEVGTELFGFSLPLPPGTTRIRFWHALNSYGSYYSWLGRSWYSGQIGYMAPITGGDVTWAQVDVAVPAGAAEYIWEADRGAFVSTVLEGYAIAVIELLSPIRVVEDRLGADSAQADDAVAPINDPDMSTGSEDAPERAMWSGDSWSRAADISGDLDRTEIPDVGSAADGREFLVLDGADTYLWDVDVAAGREGVPNWSLGDDENLLTDAVSARLVRDTDAASTADAVESRVAPTPYDFETSDVLDAITVLDKELFVIDSAAASEGYGPEMGAETVLLDLTDIWHGGLGSTDPYVTVVAYASPAGGSVAPTPTAMVRLYGNGERYADRRLGLDASAYQATHVRFWHALDAHAYGDTGQGYDEEPPNWSAPLFSIPVNYEQPVPWRQRTDPLPAGVYLWRYSKQYTRHTGTDSYYVAQIELLGCPIRPVVVVTASDTASSVDAVAPNEYQTGSESGAGAESASKEILG